MIFSSILLLIPAMLYLLDHLSEKSIENRLISMQESQMREGFQLKPPKTIEEILRRIGKQCPELGQPTCDSINLAYAALTNRQYDKAIVLYQSLAEQFPRVSEFRFNLGTAYALKKDYYNAKKELEAVVRSDSGRIEVVNNLAIVYLSLKDTSNALQAFQLALKLDPSDEITHNNLGVLFQRSGNYMAARREFHKAVQVDSHFYAARYNLGNAFYREKIFDSAEAYFRSLLKDAPEDIGAHNMRGIVLKALKRNVEAEWEFRESISLDSTDASGYVNLGGLLTDFDGRINEAQEILQKAVNIDPNSAQAHLNLGISLFKKKLYDQSKVELIKARQLYLTFKNVEMVKRIDENLELPIFHEVTELGS